MPGRPVALLAEQHGHGRQCQSGVHGPAADGDEGVAPIGVATAVTRPDRLDGRPHHHGYEADEEQGEQVPPERLTSQRLYRSLLARLRTGLGVADDRQARRKHPHDQPDRRTGQQAGPAGHLDDAVTLRPPAPEETTHHASVPGPRTK